MMSSDEMELMVDSKQLPVGWNIKYLDELCENLDSKRIPITKSSRKSGNIPYYGASGIVDYVADYIFNEDLLLVSEDGANLLARTYPIAFSITGKTWVNNHAHVLRFKEKITQSFIEYYLNSISLESYVSGMAQPKLNQKSLNSIAIPIPPLPEQKRIVAIADEAFDGIDRAIRNTEKNLSNARELFESYLNTIFTQKGDGWEEKKLEDVCQVIGGGTPSKANQEFYTGEIPWATVRDMKNEIISKTEFRITQEAVKKSSTNIIKMGNVVIATRVGLGKVCMLSQDTAINQDLKGIIPKDNDQISIRFLFWWLKSIAYLIKNEGTGATVQGVKVTFIHSLKIPVSTLTKQKQIVVILDEISNETQRLENIYRQKIAALKELKQSILQKAFTGELTADKGEK
jgi:type I restriction enzyme S subunit